MLVSISSLIVVVTFDLAYADHLSLLQTRIALQERAVVPLAYEHGGDVDKATQNITLLTVAVASAQMTHTVAGLSLDGDGYMCFIIVALVFGILAWGSLLREVWRRNHAEENLDHGKDLKSRELLWDIAKFFLMILVWCWHAICPGITIYQGWVMPAFFFLSGVVTTPAKTDRVWIRKVTVSALRDNVFNCILLMLVVHFVLYTSGQQSVGGPKNIGRPGWTLAWFLHALCICRIGIPLCYSLTRCVGEVGGSIMLVAVAGILPYMLYDPVITPLMSKQSTCLPNYCGEYIWNIMTSWIFYALGFLTDPRQLAKQLKTRFANWVSAALVVMLLWVSRSKPMWTADPRSLPYRTGVGSLQEYVHDTVGKLFYTVLFLACLAPVACMGGVIPQLLAELGQHTLHAYLINLFLWSTRVGDSSRVGDSFRLSARLTPSSHLDPSSSSFRSVVISYTVLSFATSVACCPLSARCVRWVTSPQWIFDAGVKATSMLQMP